MTRVKQLARRIAASKKAWRVRKRMAVAHQAAAKHARIENALGAAVQDIAAQAIAKNPAMKAEYLHRLATYRPSVPTPEGGSP